jgi:3-phenylpropionate/trans-cinnamate dioxygenase ferredoxin subunit
LKRFPKLEGVFDSYGIIESYQYCTLNSLAASTSVIISEPFNCYNALYSIIPKEIKMEYVSVADVSELPVNKMIMVVVGGKEVLLANVDGSYYAIANKCSHLGGSLVKGSLDGSIVTCPRHGARFDVKTGQAVADAKIAFVKMKVKDEERYPVKVDGTEILVGIP